MSGNKSQGEPTVLEKMRLLLKRYDNLVSQSYVIIIVCAFFAVYGLIDSYFYHNNFVKFGHVENLKGACVPFGLGVCNVFFPAIDSLKKLYELVGYSFGTIYNMSLFFIAILCVQGAMGFQIIRGTRMKKKMKQLRDELVRQSYLTIFDTLTPVGSSPLEKIMHLSCSVFPEIDKEKVRELTKSQTVHYRSDGQDRFYTFDSILETNEGNFIVKFFDDTVTFEHVEELVVAASDYFQDEKVFRVICVAKKYDQIFDSDILDDKMNKLKRKFRIDFILEKENDYSVLWID